MSKEKNYSSGYFLRDESGYSVVRSSFRTIEKAKQYAKERGLERIGLFVSKQQTSANNLYSRHGFVTIEEEENGRCQMECEL